MSNQFGHLHYTPVKIVLEQRFEDFTEQREEELLDDVTMLAGSSKETIRKRKKRRGCVVFEAEFPKEAALRLLAFFQNRDSDANSYELNEFKRLARKHNISLIHAETGSTLQIITSRKSASTPPARTCEAYSHGEFVDAGGPLNNAYPCMATKFLFDTVAGRWARVQRCLNQPNVDGVHPCDPSMKRAFDAFTERTLIIDEHNPLPGRALPSFDRIFFGHPDLIDSSFCLEGRLAVAKDRERLPCVWGVAQRETKPRQRHVGSRANSFTSGPISVGSISIARSRDLITEKISRKWHNPQVMKDWYLASVDLVSFGAIQSVGSPSLRNGFPQFGLIADLEAWNSENRRGRARDRSVWLAGWATFANDLGGTLPQVSGPG